MGLFDKLVNTGIGMVAGKENIKKAQPIVQAGKQVVKEIQQRSAPVYGGSDAATPEMVQSTRDAGLNDYANKLAAQPKYENTQLKNPQVDHGSILEKFNNFVKTNSQLKKLMPSDDDVATEYLKLHQPEQYQTVRSLLDSTPPNPFEVLKNNGEMKTLKDQGMFQYTQVPLEEKMKITDRIMAEKVKKLDYESFLHGVDEHFTQSLKDMYGDKTVKEMEASGLRKEMLKQAIGGYLSGKTMGLSDVLEKHLDGENIPLPVLYKDNANLATAVGVVRAATTLMGGFSTYGAISEQVGAQLKNVGGKFGSFMAKHPTFTSYIVRNAAENSVEAGVRSSTGQEYGVNDFLTGLAMGVAFQGVSDATQLLFKSPQKVTQAIEKSVKEAELAKGDALSSQEFQQTVLNTNIGHGMTVDNLIGESRFAYLKGGKNKGRPGIDYPAPLPKVEKVEVEKIPDELFNSEKGAEVYTEMKEAKPGSRTFVDGEVSGVSSTFPSWVPSDLRSSKLFQKVLGHLDEGTTPTTKKAKELYEVVKDRISGQVKREPIPEITHPMTKQELLDTADLGFEVPKEAQKKMAIADDLSTKWDELVQKLDSMPKTPDEATKIAKEDVSTPSTKVKNEKIATERKSLRKMLKNTDKSGGKSALEDFARKAFDSGYLRHFDSEGIILHEKLAKSDKEGDIWAGVASQKLGEKLKGLTKEERIQFKLLGEGRIPFEKASPKIHEVADLWREIAHDMGGEGGVGGKAQEFGLVTTRSDGTKVPFAGRENYFPKKVKTEILDKILKSKKDTLALEKQMVADGTFKNVEQANRLLAKYRDMRTSGKFGNLEHSRIEGLPESFYEQDPLNILPDYIQGAYKRLADAKQFGGQNEILDQIMASYRAKNGTAAADQLRDVFDTMAGLKQHNKTLTEVSRAVRTFENTTKLGLSAATNLGDILKPIVKYGLGDTIKATLEKFHPNGKAGKFAEKINIKNAIHDMAENIGETGFSEKIMKWTGVKATEESLRTIQAVAGKNYAQKLFKNLKKNPEGAFSKFTRRRLESLGIDTDAALKRGGLTEEDLLGAGWQSVKDMQPLGRQEVPYYWQSPVGKALTQYKSFALKQGKFLLKEVAQEAAKGNFKPLARFAFYGLLIGEETGNLRAGIRFRQRKGVGLNETVQKALEKGDPSVLGDYFTLDNWERISDSYMSIGGIGIVGDMVANLGDYGTANNIMRWMAGPTASDLFSAIGNVTQDVESFGKGEKMLAPGEMDKGKGKFQSQTLKQLTGMIPVVGQPIRNLAFPNKGTYKPRQSENSNDVQELIDQATEKPPQAGGDEISAKMEAKMKSLEGKFSASSMPSAEDFQAKMDAKMSTLGSKFAK